jgi:hypothetical protein
LCGGPAEDRAVRAPSGTGGVPISAWAPARSARSRQVQYPRQREQAILRFPPAKIARRTAVEGDLRAANDHLDYYQLSCLAVRTLHPDLLPVSPGVECRPPAGHPVRNRKTATDCIGRSMWGALGARRLLAAISPFWLLGQRMAVKRAAEVRRPRPGCSASPASPSRPPPARPSPTETAPSLPPCPPELSRSTARVANSAPRRSTQNQPLGTLRLSA